MARTAWNRRGLAGTPAIYFALAVLCAGVYALAYAGELSSQTVEGALAWLSFEYVGIPFIIPLWLLFVISITGHEQWITRGRLVALFVAPTVTMVAMLTSHWHSLFLTNPRLNPSGPLLTLDFDGGLLYWLSQFYDNLGMVLITIMIIRWWVCSQPAFRRQAQIFLLGTSLQWAGLAIFVLGIAPYNLDLSSLTLILVGLIFMIGLFRFRALDLVPMARDVIFNHMADGILVLDVTNRVIDLNPAIQEMLTVRPGAIGQLASDILRSWPGLVMQIANNAPVKVEFEGFSRHFQSELTPVRDKANQVTGKIVTIHDTTQTFQMLEQMRVLATRDPLTNLYNRRYFTELGNREFDRLSRHAGMISFVAIDIDHFKQVNDTYGHAGGDKVLQSIAKLIETTIRKPDITCRSGGEEFWALLPDTSITEALIVAERLRMEIEQFDAPFENTWIRVTASFGVSGSGHATRVTLSEMLNCADQALYEAKSGGRNCVRWCPCGE